VLSFVAEQVKSVRALGVEVGIVVGGGNIFRGMSASSATGMERATADHIGMQIAGLSPKYVSQEQIPADVLAAKRAELEADEALAKKPEAVRTQIVDGQLRKWFEEVCLLDQPFRDGEETVGQLITNAIATIGENIRVRRFVRYALGEEL
ncbi:MAG: translation elongation factor Ts, partial [Candidatus Limnocylindrus sp.]